MKKSILSLALVLCMLVGLAAPASAVTLEDLPDVELENKEVTFYFWGDTWGNYNNPDLEEWAVPTFEKVYGGKLNVLQSTGDYYENLNALILAGDAPDVIIGHDSTYPSFIMQDIAQSAEGYIYTDNPVWNESRDLADSQTMAINGHIYCLTYAFHGMGVLFYNERMMDEAGLEMPYDLWQRGEWTWDAFSEYLINLTIDNDRDGLMDVYGMAYSSDFSYCWFATTGVDAIAFDGTTFTNLLKDERIAAAADFLYNHGPMGEDVFLSGDPSSLFTNGQVAMTFTNDWRATSFVDLATTDGVGVVPLPMSPYMDTCINATMPDYYYILKGAKNPEGAGLFLLCERYDKLLNIDPAQADMSTKDRSMKWMIDGGVSQGVVDSIWTINNDLPTVLLTSRFVDFDRSQLLSTPWTTFADSIFEATNQKIIDAFTPADAE